MRPNKQINSLYTDGMGAIFNIYNFTFLVNLYEEGQLINLGKIKMSPETAKAFHKILGDNIKMYEETYGSINVYTEEVKEKEKELQAKFEKNTLEENKSSDIIEGQLALEEVSNTYIGK